MDGVFIDYGVICVEWGDDFNRGVEFFVYFLY